MQQPGWVVAVAAGSGRVGMLCTAASCATVGGEARYSCATAAPHRCLPISVSPPLPADFVQPESRRNEVLGWVKSGVRDFSISRAAVAWGIPVPRDPRQTVYVWFDALNGYLSGLLPEGHEEAAPEALAAAGWPASMHLIGKVGGEGGSPLQTRT